LQTSADDTKLVKPIEGIKSVQLLQEDLETVIKWSFQNNMELHEKKFKVLSYPLNGSSTRDLRELPNYPESIEYITSGVHCITPQETVRDLGVLLSNNRQWGPLIEKLSWELERWQHGF
jgi:hypothetical protein